MCRIYLAVFCLLLSSCVANDPIAKGLVDPLPAHAPKAPEIRKGSNLPESLQGIWLAQRQNQDVSVWSRLSFSDEMLLTTQLWGNAYDIGSFHERIIDVSSRVEDKKLRVQMVLQMEAIYPAVKSFINHFKVGTIRQCSLDIDLDQAPISFTRFCGQTVDKNQPDSENLPRFYKAHT